jgi:hypothetical protein
MLVIALCYWLDMITISWRRQVQNTFDRQPFYLFTAALPVLFAAFAIFLSWVLLVRFKPAWPSVIVGLVVGLVAGAVMLTIAAANATLLPLINLPLLTGLRTVIFELTTASLTVQACAFILVISLVNLVRKVAAPHWG